MHRLNSSLPLPSLTLPPHTNNYMAGKSKRRMMIRKGREELQAIFTLLGESGGLDLSRSMSHSEYRSSQPGELDYEYDFIDDSHSLLFLNSRPASRLGSAAFSHSDAPY